MATKVAKVKSNSEPKESMALVIPALNMKSFVVRIVGTTELLVHQFNVKTRDQIKQKQAGAPQVGKRAVRDPKLDYELSMYRGPKGEHLFPAAAFRRAMVRACKPIHGIAMVDAYCFFRMPQEYVKLEGSGPVMDERPVRVSGKADIRYRARYDEWYCDLEIRYNANATTAEQLLNLLLLAGETVGIGELRPEKGGNYGCFTISTKK